jgi:hypothetical protein
MIMLNFKLDQQFVKEFLRYQNFPSLNTFHSTFIRFSFDCYEDKVPFVTNVFYYFSNINFLSLLFFYLSTSNVQAFNKQTNLYLFSLFNRLALLCITIFRCHPEGSQWRDLRRHNVNIRRQTNSKAEGRINSDVDR